LADDSVLKNFSVITINTGAHFRDDDTFTNDVAAASRFLKAYDSTHIIVYRNTVPGHANCDTLSTPFRTVSDAEVWVASHPTYNWHAFHRQNKLAWEILQSHVQNAVLIDAYGVSITRGDVHIGNGDCLHLCVPSGPVLLWSDNLACLLTHALVTLNNSADVT
jgi:hypothetical protein